MTTLVVRGYGALSGTAVPAWDGWDAPGYVLADFDIRAELGRKGTSTLDRGTSLAMVAMERALGDAGLLPIDAPTRVGVVLGTTTGSLRSTADYVRDTLEQQRPYLVNPMLFPNTVMNRAASACAIRYGLKGVNATVAGGPVAFLQALRYAHNTIRQGYADTLLVGAVEEFSPESAWLAWAQARVAGEPTDTPGEGAALFAVGMATEDGGTAPSGAEILAVATGFGPVDERAASLADCVRRALATAGVAPSEVWRAATGDIAAAPIESDAVTSVCGDLPVTRIRETAGDCQAATGGLALAEVLATHRRDQTANGRVTVLTGVSRTGCVGAAVVRGWWRVGSDRV